MDIQEVVNIVDMCTFDQTRMQMPMSTNTDALDIANHPALGVVREVAFKRPVMAETISRPAFYQEIMKPPQLIVDITDVIVTGDRSVKPSPELQSCRRKLL